MATFEQVQRRQQWVWAMVILSLMFGGILLAFALRGTELVNPTVQQEEWVRWRTQPQPPRSP